MRPTALRIVSILPLCRGVIVPGYFFKKSCLSHSKHKLAGNRSRFLVTMAASAKERLALINENLQEILNPELIEAILEKGDAPRNYWGEELTA